MAVSCILAFKSEQSPDLEQTGLHFIAPRIHCLIPSAMAPSTRMPDSLTTQSGWNSSSFSTGSRGGSNSSRNTFARTSRAAAEHLPTEDMHMLYMGLDVSLSTNVTLGFESFLWIRQYEYLNITDIHDIECNHLHRKHQVCEQSLISAYKNWQNFTSGITYVDSSRTDCRHHRHHPLRSPLLPRLHYPRAEGWRCETCESVALCPARCLAQPRLPPRHPTQEAERQCDETTGNSGQQWLSQRPWVRQYEYLKIMENIRDNVIITPEARLVQKFLWSEVTNL